jgi:hypothetical protein
MSRRTDVTIMRGIVAGALSLVLLGLPAGIRAQELEPTPASGERCAVVEAPATCGPVAIPIEPDPAVVDAHPTPWDHISVSADGRTLEVSFWMGVTECHGLHSVEVSRERGELSVTPMIGAAPGAEGRFCIALAQLYVTTIVLEEPLIGNVS